MITYCLKKNSKNKALKTFICSLYVQECSLDSHGRTNVIFYVELEKFLKYAYNYNEITLT